MDSFKLFMPTELHFGVGEFEKTGEYAASLGKKAFVCTGKILAELGLGEKLTEILKKTNIEAVIYDGAMANPICHAIDKAAEICVKEKCDFVIGLGGGSPMDFAKAVAVTATHDGPAWSYVNYSGAKFTPPTEKTLPILTIATTAGTGSEVTPYAVVVNPESQIKAAINSPYTCPKISVVDPKLMVTKPARLTAATGMDAFAHAVESYINTVRSTSFSDITAIEAIRLTAKSLEMAVKDGGNIEARTDMAWASTLAGITISQANTTVVHAMSHPVSGRTNAGHGDAVALLLVPVMKKTWQHAVEKFAAVAEAMGVDPSISSVEQKAEAGIEKMAELLKNIGLDIGLRDLGISKDDLAQLTDDTMGYMFRPLGQHPIEFTREDISKIFNEAY